METRINLSEVIANGEAYSLEAPIPQYEVIARKVQVELAENFKLTPCFDSEESQYWLTDRVALESVLLSENDEQVYIYNHQMYVAAHSTGDEASVGYAYYGTLYPSIAVVVDGIEMGRATDKKQIVKLAVDAIVCSLARPVPKTPYLNENPSYN